MDALGDPETITQISSVTDTLRRIGEIVDPNFSEDEVQMVFLNEGYFSLLGYSEIGKDLRSEVSIGGRRADYVTTGDQFEGVNAPTTVYEFKNPREGLTGHKTQLQDCVDIINAEHGVLTNGKQFEVYERVHGGIEQFMKFELIEAEEYPIGAIVRKLSYLSIKERNLRTMAEMSAELVVKESPQCLWEHPGISEAVIETFAEHYAEFLLNELTEERNASSE